MFLLKILSMSNKMELMYVNTYLVGDIEAIFPKQTQQPITAYSVTGTFYRTINRFRFATYA